MSNVFVLRNQDHRFFDKHGEWTDGSDSNSLYRTPYKDEALNQKLELTVRHPELRITVVDCWLDAKGRPQLDSESNAEQESLLPEQEESASHSD